MKHSLLICLFIFSFVTFAASTAKVQKLRGSVVYNGQALKKGDQIKEGGTLEVKEKSYIKLFIEDFGSTVAIAPNSKMKLSFSQKKKKSALSLLAGTLRWQTQKKAKQRGFVRTKKAVFGVRGTDFLIVVNPVLDESEIICYDGKVKFTSRSDKKDFKMIGKNQWGGIGGRFGQKTGEILTLPTSVVDHFKSLLE